MKKEELENLRPTIKIALEKAANFCAYQERCQEEVKKKLFDLKIDSEDVDEVIYLLIKEDFLNEERFSKTYCRSKFKHNKWGKNKIIQNLKQKKVSERNIKTGLLEINNSEYYNLAESLIEKKKNSINDKNHWVRKQKITNYMVQKGFEFELIKEFI